ncbi:GNAT family N-acetyltransferase [Sphingobacterium gobiense]|uniref:N-acetyltransferase domain-containing protein n=1 Tax=Sphingobacterium gobiense TaxID=1382456 RepID=A0A2S9JU81_9SPHI|nr:hypothetical protein C5749_06380 [Sphingobacterium gobiense]
MARFELKNIAVAEAYQNQGIGKFMLADAEKRALSALPAGKIFLSLTIRSQYTSMVYS